MLDLPTSDVFFLLSTLYAKEDDIEEELKERAEKSPKFAGYLKSRNDWLESNEDTSSSTDTELKTGWLSGWFKMSPDIFYSPQATEYESSDINDKSVKKSDVRKVRSFFIVLLHN